MTLPDWTLHVVYPSGPAIRAPATIGRNLLRRLEGRYRVAHYGWDEVRLVRPGPGDVLLGHPHPVPWTVFRLSARQPGWRRVLVMCPYAHGDRKGWAYLDPAIRRADLYLAITGRYWAAHAAEGPFRHWAPKMVHLDLAVDRAEFPRVKGAFAPPGQRRFLYIGNTTAIKNIGYLSAIARAMPETEISWIGSRQKRIPGLRELGRQDFSLPAAREMVAAHDFLLTVGRSDPNPTTILESMAWGLVPVCTRQSGYEGEPGIVNVPLDDVDGAVRVLRELQGAPAERLEALRAANDERLGTHYNWDRFAAQVVEAIESPVSHAGTPAPISDQARNWWAAATSHGSAWRPANALQVVRAEVKRRARRAA
jgi:glycosyltransferase involved in cell wall biosynthesis